MRYQLRPYQLEAVEAVRACMRAGKRRVVIVAATGAGKTIIATHIIESAVAKNSRILFLAHRRELIEQCSTKLDEMDIDHGIIKADHPRTRPEMAVQVASVQTLIRRDKPKADIIIVDECHHALARSYQDIVDGYPDVILLGLTATPWRLDGRGLGKLYDELVVVSSVKELVTEGYLIDPKVLAPSKPDLAKIRVTAGEYNARELEDAMDQAKLVGDIVKHWREHASERRTVVFASGVAHSKHLAEKFREAGVAAEHVDGSTPEKERADIFERLSGGKTQVLCNCDIVSEGYDLPALSCAVLARPTKSSVKFLQFCGRIMRPWEGKDDALILDHAGGVYEHGFVADERLYSLDDTKKVNGEKGKPPIKHCPKCQAVLHLSAMSCPHCGYEYERKEVEVAMGALEEADPNARLSCVHCGSKSTKLHRFDEFTVGIYCRTCGKSAYDHDRKRADEASGEERHAVWLRLDAIREKYGYKSAWWVGYKYKDVFGVWPPKNFA